MADAEITGLVVKIKGDLSDYQKKLDQMDKQTVTTSSRASAAFEKIAVLSAGAGVAIAGFAATAVNSAMKWGTAVDDLVDKTGMAGQEASKLLAVAKSTGVSTDEANQMFAKFGKSVYNAADAMSKAAASGKSSDDVLTRLGVSALNVDGSMRNTVEIFQDVKNKLNDMQDGWQKTAIEMELFGRSGTAMHDMLNMSQEEMDKVIEKARSMGLIISSETAAAWEKFERQLNSTKGTLTSVGIGIGNEILPKLQEMLGAVQNVTTAYVNMDAEQKKNINTLISFISYSGSAALAVRALGLAVGAAVNPWVLLAAAIGGAIVALNDYLQAKHRVDSYNPKAEVQKSHLTGENLVKYYDENLGGYNWRPMSAAEQEAQTNYEQTGKRPEDYVPQTPETPDPDTFVGGGGSTNAGGSRNSKTALQSYMEETSKLQGIWEQEASLGQISRTQFQQLLQERLAGLKAIEAGDDEVLDKQRSELDLTIRVNEIGKQARQEAIETAKQKLQVNEINKQQYLEVLQSQTKLVTTDKERYEMQVKILSVQKEIADAAIKQISNQLIAKQSDLAMQEEAGRSKLAIQGITNSNDKIELMRAEYEQKREYIRREYDLETESLDLELKALKDNNQESSDEYKDLLEKKKQLTAKYNLDMEKANNAAIEKQVSEQQKIIDANNDMISDLIIGTRSGHDILEDMWSDFVKKVIAKMSSINTSMNIFEQILGPLFGLGTSVKASSVGSTGSTNMGDFKSQNRYAVGGRPPVGVASLVGELGPELFIPDSPGTIIPNNKIGSVAGGTAPQISLTVVNNTGTEADVKINQPQFDGEGWVCDVVLEKVARSPIYARNLRTALGG